MKKFKIILGYILSFILCVLIVGLVGIFILKSTILDNNYIKYLLDNNNYYEEVSNDVLENMKNYNMSSGLPEEVLNNIYDINDIKIDINSYIDGIYNNEIVEISVDKLKTNLSDNIDNYFTDYDVKLTSESNLNSYIDEIGNIYIKEVSFYNSLNSFVNSFNKLINMISNISKIIMTGIIIILISLIILRISYFGSIFTASGIILLFIRLVFYDKIDINNLLVVSEFFSKIIRMSLNNIGLYLYNSALILIILGLIISFLESFKNKDK